MSAVNACFSFEMPIPRRGKRHFRLRTTCIDQGTSQRESANPRWQKRTISNLIR